MRFEESDMQQQCVNWFRNNYPSLILFAIPNGGRRNVREAARLKKEGVLAGVADLFLAYPKGQFHGLFIEMKSQKGVLQNTQKDFKYNVENQGYAYTICKSLDDFKSTVYMYLNGY